MPVLMFFGWIALAVVQFSAFADGMGDWFHVGRLGAFVAFIPMMMFGPLGALVVAIIAFHGAVEVWDWYWWQALLLVAPGVAIQALLTGVGGIVFLIGSLFRPRTSN